MEELIHCVCPSSLDKLNGVRKDSTRIIGGCIEGDLGSKYVKTGGIFCQTVTALDVPVKKNATMSLVHPGKELKNLEEITQEHIEFGQKGTLKESIIEGFPETDFFKTQTFVILYYLSKLLAEHETNNQRVTKRMHVHVHRGSSMGPQHLRNLKTKLHSYLFVLDILKENKFPNFVVRSNVPNELNDEFLASESWIFQSYCTNRNHFSSVNITLTFGYGYKENELAPPSLRSVNPTNEDFVEDTYMHDIFDTIVDFYYSISLIVGFDPEMSSGQTNIPNVLVDFDTKSIPAVLHLSKKHVKQIQNHLTTEWEKLENWARNMTFKVPIVINKGIVLKLTGGIYNPEPTVKIFIDYGWHPPGTIIKDVLWD